MPPCVPLDGHTIGRVEVFAAIPTPFVKLVLVDMSQSNSTLPDGMLSGFGGWGSRRFGCDCSVGILKCVWTKFGLREAIARFIAPLTDTDATREKSVDQLT